MTGSTSLFDLSGRVAAVTGGNGGIGRGIALGLAAAGAAIAVLSRNSEKNRAVLEELKPLGVPAMAKIIDLAKRDELGSALDEVERTLGPVDILVNNAGIAIIGGTLDQKPEEWDMVIETNLNSCFFLSRLAARSMIKQRCGKIINIASEYALFGSGFHASYSVAKGGLVQLTKSMAIEYAPFNIQVNAIAPGWIETDLTAPIKGTPFNDEIVHRTPAGRWGKPEDLAGTAVYLASKASDFVTGATIFVDGGYAVR